MKQNKNELKNQDVVNGLSTAVEFIGTKDNHIILHDGPKSIIPAMFQETNNILTKKKLQVKDLRQIQSTRETLLRQSVENIMISLVISCFNLNKNIPAEQLDIIEIGEAQRGTVDVPTDDNKFSLSNPELRKLLFDEYNGRPKFSFIHYRLKDILELDAEFIAEFAHATTMNLYNTLLTFVETDYDLLTVKSIILPFQEKLMLSLISLAETELESYNFMYLSEKIDSSRLNNNVDPYYYDEF